MENIKQNIINEFESKLEIIGGEKLYRARNIMNIFGYSKWERFEGAIKRTIESLGDENIAKKNFFPVEKVNTGGRPGRDYLLTRGACYFLIKNCDYRKQEVNTLYNYLNETYKNQKIKKDLSSKSKNIILKSNLKIFSSLSLIFLLIFLTVYFLFDFKKDIINTEEINVYNEIKKLEEIQNKKVENNNILINSAIEDNNESIEEKELFYYAEKLEKYIRKGGGEKFISYTYNPRTEFTQTLSGVRLIENYFLFGNNGLYKDACSLLSKKYCNALSKDLSSFEKTWTNTTSGYEILDVYEKETGVYCIKTKSILKDDLSQKPIVQTFSYKTFIDNGIEYINGRFCEKIEKDGKKIACPYELKNYYCIE